MDASSFIAPLQRAVSLGEISVCTDCMLMAANGETGELNPTQPEPWALWGTGYEMFMGREKSYIAGEISDDEADVYASDELGFSWQSCEGCGSHLGGDRYAFIMYAWTVEYAMVMHRWALDHARDFSMTNASREMFRDQAARIRGYVAERLRIDRSF